MSFRLNSTCVCQFFWWKNAFPHNKKKSNKYIFVWMQSTKILIAQQRTNAWACLHRYYFFKILKCVFTGCRDAFFCRFRFNIYLVQMHVKIISISSWKAQLIYNKRRKRARQLQQQQQIKSFKITSFVVQIGRFVPFVYRFPLVCCTCNVHFSGSPRERKKRIRCRVCDK